MYTVSVTVQQQSLVLQPGVLHGLSYLLGCWLGWGWDGGDGYLIGQPLPSLRLPQQVVFSLFIFSPLLLRSLQHMVHPLLCSLWLGGGRGHVYDIIGSRGGWGAVDMRCSSRAEGAVLDGGRSVAGVWGGVWRPSVVSREREVKIIIIKLGYRDTSSSPFLKFRFTCLFVAGPHPPHDYTHQEYG